MSARALTAEALGTGLLLLSVVGSGIMAERLTGDVALALMANAIATGAMLYAIITCLGPVSGAHFNPAVTLYFAARRGIAPGLAAAYVAAQITGGILGVWTAHFIFAEPILQASATARTGAPLWGSEIVATFGLFLVIAGGLASRPAAVPALVATYITGAYWFTASTSFANPAVTIARTLSDTFAGIAPADAPLFILMQLAGTGAALALLPWLLGPPAPPAAAGRD